MQTIQNKGASILELITSNQAGIYTSIPARVIAWRAAKQVVDVEIVIKRPFITGSSDEAIKVLDVPVMFMQGGSWTIGGEMKVGDIVLLIFPMFNIDTWLTGDVTKTYKPSGFQLHNLDGAFALCGGLNYNRPTLDQRFLKKFHIVKGNNYIVMDETSIEIEANNGACRIEMLSDGTMNITTNATTNITSSHTNINNSTTIDGDLQVNGDISNTGDTTTDGTTTSKSGMLSPTYGGYGGAGSMTIGSATINGVVIETHTHRYDGNQVTEPPQ